MTHLTASRSRRSSEANFQKRPVQNSKRLHPPRHCHSLLEEQACVSLISVAVTGFLRLGCLKERVFFLAHRLRLGGLSCYGTAQQTATNLLSVWTPHARCHIRTQGSVCWVLLPEMPGGLLILPFRGVDPA